MTRSAYLEVKAIIENHGYTVETIRDYLDEMRNTGRINMYGAGDYLIRVWGFNRHTEAKPIVLDYMNHGLREDKAEDLLCYGRDKPEEKLE